MDQENAAFPRMVVAAVVADVAVAGIAVDAGVAGTVADALAEIVAVLEVPHCSLVSETASNPGLHPRWVDEVCWDLHQFFEMRTYPVQTCVVLEKEISINS